MGSTILVSSGRLSCSPVDDRIEKLLKTLSEAKGPIASVERLKSNSTSARLLEIVRKVSRQKRSLEVPLPIFTNEGVGQPGSMNDLSEISLGTVNGQLYSLESLAASSRQSRLFSTYGTGSGDSVLDISGLSKRTKRSDTTTETKSAISNIDSIFSKKIGGESPLTPVEKILDKINSFPDTVSFLQDHYQINSPKIDGSSYEQNQADQLGRGYAEKTSRSPTLFALSSRLARPMQKHLDRFFPVPEESYTLPHDKLPVDNPKPKLFDRLNTVFNKDYEIQGQTSQVIGKGSSWLNVNPSTIYGKSIKSPGFAQVVTPTRAGAGLDALSLLNQQVVPPMGEPSRAPQSNGGLLTEDNVLKPAENSKLTTRDRGEKLEGGAGLMITLTGDVVIDGHRLGRITATSQAREASLPARGPSRVNLRAVPIYSGMQIPG